jgi:hypothetical protein
MIICTHTSKLPCHLSRYRYVAIDWEDGEMHIIDSISSIWHGIPYEWKDCKIYIIT